jgi:hypothetical protein
MNKNYTEFENQAFFLDPTTFYAADYDPKLGYQVGILYNHHFLKSLVAGGEIGYLNKGQKVVSHIGRRYFVSVEHNYIYLKPSIAYTAFGGLIVNLGINFNKKVSLKGLEQAKSNDSDVSYSIGLAYIYINIGVSLDYNKNFKTTQVQKLLGETYLFRHHWYGISLMYAIYGN